MKNILKNSKVINTKSQEKLNKNKDADALGILKHVELQTLFPKKQLTKSKTLKPHINLSFSQIPVTSDRPRCLQTTSSSLFRRRSKSVTDVSELTDRGTSFSITTVNEKVQTGRIVTVHSGNITTKETGTEVSVISTKTKKENELIDYKSRFEEIHIKYEELIKTFENVQTELKTVQGNSGELAIKHDDLSKGYEKVSKENAQFISKIINLNNLNSELGNKLEKVIQTIAELQNANDEYKSREAIYLEEIEKLNIIKMRYLSLENEYDILVKDKSLLKSEIAIISEENKQLKRDLSGKVSEYEQLKILTENLKQQLTKQEKLRHILHNTIQDLKGNIRVFCRIRPPVTDVEKTYALCQFNYIDDNILEIPRCKENIFPSSKVTDSVVEFMFDKVFQPNSSQENIFEELAQLVQSALDGYNICVFAYGQTGSGKTYTMLGLENPADLGLLPRTIDLIFQTIEDLKKSGWKYEVKASFLEIYNENVFDLLISSKNQNLDICFNEGKGTTVPNLKVESVDNSETLKSLMIKAHENRRIQATNFNERSSRSHAVTKIYLSGVNTNSESVYSGSVSLVDLAGSESAKITSCDQRLYEARYINRSLSALGNVILALRNKEKHIPFRNSKLTYLLQSSLGGNCKTLMIVNTSPFEHNLSESMNSLRFGSKVKEVKTISKRNKIKT